MKYALIICFSILLFTKCKKEFSRDPKDFSEVEIETIINDSLLNVRAIEIANNRIWFAGSNGETGCWNIPDYDASVEQSNVFAKIANMGHYNEGVRFRQMNSDTSGYELRAITKITDKYFTLTAGSPAVLTKYDSFGRKIVYQEDHPKAFYDSMCFWNDQEGIAIGDPTDGCMSIIVTRDGGETWTKLPCEQLPKSEEGEAAFAASNTNIAVFGNHTWIATGGKVSRIWYSPDKGKNWEVYKTPILQGAETTGIFSVDFYNELDGFAIGGDYTKPELNASNKIRTTDGGKTWHLVAKSKNPGYRSCVQYIPHGAGKELVAIGFLGIDYSKDSGESWKHLSDEGFHTIRFLNDSVAYAAGKGRICRLKFK